MGVIPRFTPTLADGALTPIQLRLSHYVAKSPYPSPIKGEEVASALGTNFAWSWAGVTERQRQTYLAAEVQALTSTALAILLAFCASDTASLERRRKKWPLAHPRGRAFQCR